MEFETPETLLGRLKLGREETIQRLLTSLILRGPYPRWNTRARPSSQGLEFLRAVYDLSIGAPWPGDDCTFVDEYELAPRHDAEKGGAPDWVVLWPDRIWIIELKTEKGSHRPAQVPSYFVLGRHHHPDCAVDLTYLTGPMDAPFATTEEWERYAHLTWAGVAPIIETVWTEPTDPGEREVVAGVLGCIEHLHLRPSEWRELITTAVPPAEPATTPLDESLRLAALTAQDGEQRALDRYVGGLDELLALRLATRDTIAASSDDALRHVVPWLWRIESTGAPLTSAGAESGHELRFSRYSAPQY